MKFDEMNKGLMIDALLRHFHFNIPCSNCGGENKGAFNEWNEKCYYNTECFKCRQGKKNEGDSWEAKPEEKVNVDEILDF